MHADHILTVGLALFLRHAHILQLAASLLKAGRRGVVANGTVLQISHPLLDGCLGHLVETVNYQQEILWEHLLG